MFRREKPGARRLGATVLACALVSGGAPPAFAGERDPTAADALFQQGRTEAAAGQFERACVHFEESYRLDPTVGTLLNWADCSEHRGQIAAALVHFSEARREFVPADNRVPYVEQRIASLKSRVPRLKIDAPADPQARVERDGVELGPGALNVALPLEPGHHVVRVQAPGRKDHEVTVEVPEGAEQEIRAEVGEALSTASAAVNASPLGVNGNPAHQRSASAGPWIALGIGAAGVLVGAVAGALVIGDASTVSQQCPSHSCPTSAADKNASDAASRAQTMETVSTIGFGVGAAGGAVALVWRLVDSSQRSATAAGAGATGKTRASGAWVVPTAGRASLGVAAGGTFE
jgi:hypothetical protein